MKQYELYQEINQPPTVEDFPLLDTSSRAYKEFMKDGGWNFVEVVTKSGYDPKDFIDVPFVKKDSNRWSQERPNGKTFGVLR